MATNAAVKKKDWQFYFSQLQSDECMCEREKKPKFAFCYRCYKALPDELQRALYRRIGQGFEQAYEQSCIYLSQQVW